MTRKNGVLLCSSACATKLIALGNQPSTQPRPSGQPPLVKQQPPNIPQLRANWQLEGSTYNNNNNTQLLSDQRGQVTSAQRPSVPQPGGGHPDKKHKVSSGLTATLEPWQPLLHATLRQQQQHPAGSGRQQQKPIHPGYYDPSGYDQQDHRRQDGYRDQGVYDQYDAYPDHLQGLHGGHDTYHHYHQDFDQQDIYHGYRQDHIGKRDGYYDQQGLNNGRQEEKPRGRHVQFAADMEHGRRHAFDSDNIETSSSSPSPYHSRDSSYSTIV